jgi:hypothetical protein
MAGSVRIDYGIAVAGDVSLGLYDVRGRLVRQLTACSRVPGPPTTPRLGIDPGTTAGVSLRGSISSVSVRTLASRVQRIVLAN